MERSLLYASSVIKHLWGPNESYYFLRHYFQPIGAEHVRPHKNASDVKKNTKHNRLQQNTEHTHSRRKEKEDEDEDEEGGEFSQRGSKVAESNLLSPH